MKWLATSDMVPYHNFAAGCRPAYFSLPYVLVPSQGPAVWLNAFLDLRSPLAVATDSVWMAGLIVIQVVEESPAAAPPRVS